ncbi:hypothetical protein LG047_09200 [Methylocystis sp. WRRC1]|uniref:hypothetical protein n=1 Tax=unclassified Methylocystis TaxID=2625913 RepID=UPI0001F88808|nr:MULTISPECIES: hypothetical protein [unclassified Methylocystis]MCC3245494.1 hypothetical protein [Methylocystis sp. WRRC1]
MFGNKKMAGVRATLAALALCGAIGFSAAPAQAAKLGPYFPIPNGFNLTGIARDALLNIQTSWLQNGLDNLEKAKKETAEALEKAKDGAQDQVAALEEKLKGLDKMIEDTKAELEIAKDTNPSREVQAERKSKLLLNLNQWINELNHLATEQMKIAILKDGVEAMAAQNRNYQLSEQADNLEKAKRDPSIENWGK